MTQILDIVLEHGDAFNPHAKGKSVDFLWVVARHTEYRWMHHAAPKNLHPACALAYLAPAPPAGAARDIYLSTRFRKGKVTGAQPNLALCAKHLPGKHQEYRLQVG